MNEIGINDNFIFDSEGLPSIIAWEKTVKNALASYFLAKAIERLQNMPCGKNYAEKWLEFKIPGLPNFMTYNK